MYENFFVIMDMLINNNMTKKEIASKIIGVLKDKISDGSIDKITNYIGGESVSMKKVLSRDHMISEGISEENVDYVINEIRIFIKNVRNTDEMRSQCGYENMALADFLWHWYCNLYKREEVIECMADLKRGLFVIAKAWNEPPEEASIIEFIKRIDSKESKILLGMEDVKTDTEELKKEAKDTNRKVNEIYLILKEELGDSSNKSEKEEQTSDGQEKQNPGEPNDELGALPSESTSGQKEANTEAISADEIKICLAAAPDEFQKEIDGLKEFIEEQNQCQDAVRLKLECYDGETAQDFLQYKYCYLLVGAKMKTWIQEAYELVCGLIHNEACDTEYVQLRLFFRRVSDGKTVQDDNSGREQLENRYRNDFKRIPYYFSDINRIKLDILQNLRNETSEVNFSTESILQFQNNTDFKEACKKREALLKQYIDAGEVIDTDKSPEEKKQIRLLEDELNEQNDVVKKMEREIWDNLNLLTEKLQTERAMDIREAEAIEGIIEYGNYENADVLLRSEKWNQEVVDLEQSMKEKQEMLRQFISSQRTLISNLKTKGTGNSLENEIIEVYERITEISKEWHIDYITLYEFAEFLLNQRKCSKGIKIGEELKCLYELSDCASAEERVRLLKLLGDLYFEAKEYDKSQRDYIEAYEIFIICNDVDLVLGTEITNNLARLFWKTNQLEHAENALRKNIDKLSILVEREPQKYEPKLAVTYNYMGIMANKRNQLDKAIDYHRKVLEIRERLAGKSSSYNYRPIMDLTITYNNLACVYKKWGDYREAEKYYRKALDIRSRNEKINPSAFRKPLALSYSNYASILNLCGDNEKAQKMCEKAYTIRRDLAQITPSDKVELANTLHEYGIILTDAGERMYFRAKEYFEEAIEIRENLTKDDEMTYEWKLAETCSYYGKLLAKMGKDLFRDPYYGMAEVNMRRACEICDKYLTRNKEYNANKRSEIYQRFATLLDEDLKKYSEAEVYYKKAIKGWKELTDQCPQAFEKKLKKADEALRALQKKIHEAG
ncbi:MAG: tetratricopeptide repeat protein [Lachnospiraceae bacterium]|nr:tetratricopeptide repeat protein [Lachnospiraceae bacterium]